MFTYFLKDKSDAVNATKRFSAHIAPYGKIKSLNFDNDVFPSGKVKLVRSDNGGGGRGGGRGNIYQKVFGTFLFKILLNMNLLHHIRLAKMVQENEIGAPCLIRPDLCY